MSVKGKTKVRMKKEKVETESFGEPKRPSDYGIDRSVFLFKIGGANKKSRE